MPKILINFAHPSLSKSKINKALLTSLQGVEDVTVNNLYAEYPDFLIDVKREQALCESHDIIIFQHPFYWYSAPSIIREWQDLVLEHGWAYGSKGKALEGKYFMHAITAGGDDVTYQKEGYNQHTIADLLSPFRATINLCKGIWLPPFMVMGVHRGLPEDKVRYYSEEYRRTIIALRDNTLNFDIVKQENYINSNLYKCLKNK